MCFSFFGWFPEAECKAGKWRYVRGAPHLHVLFGWIEVADVLPVVQERERCISRFPWMSNHPHVSQPHYYTDPRNVLYIAHEKSRFNSIAAYGGGRFAMYDDRLRLTQLGNSRSVWSLPPWFMPRSGRAPLSYHPRPDQWQQNDDGVTLHSAAKGQEFVLDGAIYPEAEQWVGTLVSNHS
jgi:hypothetical protein